MTSVEDRVKDKDMRRTWKGALKSTRPSGETSSFCNLPLARSLLKSIHHGSHLILYKCKYKDKEGYQQDFMKRGAIEVA